MTRALANAPCTDQVGLLLTLVEASGNFPRRVALARQSPHASVDSFRLICGRHPRRNERFPGRSTSKDGCSSVVARGDKNGLSSPCSEVIARAVEVHHRNGKACQQQRVCTTDEPQGHERHELPRHRPQNWKEAIECRHRSRQNLLAPTLLTTCPIHATCLFGHWFALRPASWRCDARRGPSPHRLPEPDEMNRSNVITVSRHAGRCVLKAPIVGRLRPARCRGVGT